MEEIDYIIYGAGVLSLGTLTIILLAVFIVAMVGSGYAIKSFYMRFSNNAWRNYEKQVLKSLKNSKDSDMNRWLDKIVKTYNEQRKGEGKYEYSSTRNGRDKKES